MELKLKKTPLFYINPKEKAIVHSWTGTKTKIIRSRPNPSRINPPKHILSAKQVVKRRRFRLRSWRSFSISIQGYSEWAETVEESHGDKLKITIKNIDLTRLVIVKKQEAKNQHRLSRKSTYIFYSIVNRDHVKPDNFPKKTCRPYETQAQY